MKDGRLDRFARGTERAAAALILALVLLFLLALTLSAYTQTAELSTADQSGEHIELEADNVFLNLLLLVLELSALYLFYRRCDAIRAGRMELALLLWLFLLGTAFIASTKLRAPPYSDSFIVTYAAQRAALGDHAMLAEDYFRRFPFQLGYVLYSELFFRAAGLLLRGRPEGYAWLALQELNLLWLLFAFHALICSTRLLFRRERTEKLLMLLMFLCLQGLLSTTYLYGSIPAFACGAGALWMFLRHRETGRLRDAALCALLLTAAVTLKLNLLIFCVAIGGVWLVELLRQRSLRSALCLLLTALCVLTISRLPQRLYERRTQLEFGGGIPMIAWMAMGLSEGHAAPGWYRETYTVTAFENSGFDREAVAENARAVIAERLRGFARRPGEGLRFFRIKLRSQWNEPSYGSLWINQVHLSFSEKGGLYRFFCGGGAHRTLIVMNQVQQLVLLGTLLSLPGLWRRKSLRCCTLLLIVLGGLLYHLLFEAKSQYALPYFLLMLPMAACGFCALFRKIEYR